MARGVRKPAAISLSDAVERLQQRRETVEAARTRLLRAYFNGEVELFQVTKAGLLPLEPALPIAPEAVDWEAGTVNPAAFDPAHYHPFGRSIELRARLADVAELAPGRQDRPAIEDAAIVEVMRALEAELGRPPGQDVAWRAVQAKFGDAVKRARSHEVHGATYPKGSTRPGRPPTR